MAMMADGSDLHYRDRREIISSRRMDRSNHTTIAFKNNYFKQAIAETHIAEKSNALASAALKMSEMESHYGLIYQWGGSVKNHIDGLDCTGFVHGLLYYLALPGGERRLNTKSLYLKLKRDSSWLTIYDSLNNPEIKFDTKNLRPGDIILWPSDLDDSKNLPGPIWGHVGIAVPTNEILQVTHFVSSEAYDDFDTIGPPGPGINTMPATEFIKLKQRGILSIFRLKSAYATEKQEI